MTKYIRADSYEELAKYHSDVCVFDHDYSSCEFFMFDESILEYDLRDDLFIKYNTNDPDVYYQPITPEEAELFWLASGGTSWRPIKEVICEKLAQMFDLTQRLPSERIASILAESNNEINLDPSSKPLTFHDIAKSATNLMKGKK